jgi:microcompartment protein CcmK/EutM
MQIARVIGSVVSTSKSDRLTGLKLLLVREIDLDTFREKGSPVVAIDTVGAGEGEVVMTCAGSSSRMTETTKDKPADCTITAIIDSIDIGGRRIFDKHGEGSEN